MMHFTSVLLPAPFSPTRAWQVPGLGIERDALVGDERTEALGDVDQLFDGKRPAWTRWLAVG